MSDKIEIFIDDFLAHDYDPFKAHEYYIRTRKLVGRGVKKAKNIDNPFKNRSLVPQKRISDLSGNRDIRDAKIRNNQVQESNRDANRANSNSQAERTDLKSLKSRQKNALGPSQARADRLEEQQLKATALRKRLKDLPPEKRKKAEINLNGIERKLNRARSLVSNAKKNVDSVRGKSKDVRRAVNNGKKNVKSLRGIRIKSASNPFVGAKLSRTP